MSDANLQAVFFDFDGVICQTEVCRLDGPARTVPHGQRRAG